MGTDGNGRNGWGRFLVVEVKAQAGRLRPEQTLFLERIRAAGGVAFVARDCRIGLVLRTACDEWAPPGGAEKSVPP